MQLFPKREISLRAREVKIVEPSETVIERGNYGYPRDIFSSRRQAQNAPYSQDCYYSPRKCIECVGHVSALVGPIIVHLCLVAINLFKSR